MGVYGLKIKWIGPVKGDKYKFLPQMFSNLDICNATSPYMAFCLEIFNREQGILSLKNDIVVKFHF